MLNIKAFIIIILLLFTKLVEAQFSDSVAYYAGFTSTGTFNRTNASSNFMLNNALKLSAKKKSLAYNFANRWLYGKQNQKLTNNDLISSLDINLYKTFPHFYYWGLFNYTSSYSLKINNQLQCGLGIAYNIIDRKNIALNISDGIIYDFNDIINEEGNREIYSTFRNSARLQFKCTINNLFSFNGNGFYQNSLNYKNDYIIRSDVHIGLKLRKWISVTAGFTYNEMSRTNTQNLFATYGVVIEKYF